MLGLDRRSLLLAAGASLAATPARARSRSTGVQLEINLADTIPAAPASADVATGRDAARRMSVGVELNRQGPFTFVIDTGANSSVVASETAAKLGLPAAGEEPVHGIAGAEASQTVLVDRLSVGSVTSRRLRLPTLGADHLGVQGLLGVDVLRDRRVTLNFHDDLLEIGPSYDGVTAMVNGSGRLRGFSSDGSDGSGVMVPARYRSGQLIILDADVGGLPVTAFLDSGSQNTVANLALYREMVAHKPEQVAKLASVELISATGQVAPGDLCLLPSLRLGGLKMTGLSAVYADLHTFDIWGLSQRPSILVGIDVLRHFGAVDLDFGRRQVTFHPASTRRG